MRNRLNELLPDATAVHSDIVIERSLAGAAPVLLARVGLESQELLLVCDANGYTALGSRLVNELERFRIRLLMLHAPVRADEKALQRIMASPGDALIAVGSGTVNDLCKYASFKRGIPYAVFPTAPSMNGYLSANASLSMDGIKASHPAQVPEGVFCDLGVLADAPPRLIRSGLGDSLCRPTAQADWLLSHLLLGTHYSKEPFDLLKPFEAELFAHADKLLSRDLEVVELLVKTLLASGLGMTLMGGSHPASQGEHMIAHTMEMKYGESLPQNFHGEEIGVTTLTMARLQETLLARPLSLPPLPEREKALEHYFGAARGKALVRESAVKYSLYARYGQLNEKLRQSDGIRDQLRQAAIPESALRAVLEKAGAPSSPEDLGWKESAYRAAVQHAAFTRNRFTFLDLLG